METTNLVSSQSKRYFEIDFVKFAAIIFMIFVHVYEVFSHDAFWESHGYENNMLYFLNYIIEFFGGVTAAPAFMFCMGLGITFSKNPMPSKFMKRGVKILLVGLLVNFFEEILPIFWETPSFEEILEAIPGLFSNDVYFFFGLTFFFFAFAFIVKKPVLICSIAGVLSLIGSFFLPYMDFASDNIAKNLVLGLFVYTNEYVFFPITAWIVFPTAGYLFGRIMSKVDIKANLYKISAAVSVGILALTTVFGLSLGYTNSMLNALECSAYDYYVPNFFSQLWGVAFVIVWIAISYLIVGKIKDGKFRDLVIWSSENIMPIYVLQWLVIALMIPVLKLSYNIFFPYIACALITVMTFGFTKIYLSLKKKMRKL